MTHRCRSSSPQLFDLVIREETLLNVIKSVTRNGRSIILTAVLAIFLVYFFSIIGFLFLKDDFRMEVDRLPAPGQNFSVASLPSWQHKRLLFMICPGALRCWLNQGTHSKKEGRITTSPNLSLVPSRGHSYFDRNTLKPNMSTSCDF